MTVCADDSAPKPALENAPIAARGSESHRQYSAWRARQIAYGRWSPWADAQPVREHVRRLRQSGSSYQTIARAAHVSVAAVWSLMHGQPSKARGAPERIRTAQARRLLAVSTEGISEGRRSSAGARRRLQALVAVGHNPTYLARQIGVPPRRILRITNGDVSTVSYEIYAAVRDLYDQAWDQRPPEWTTKQRAAASAARHRAAREGWPPPMALDDDRLDDPSYRPTARWRPAIGVRHGTGQSTHPRHLNKDIETELAHWRVGSQAGSLSDRSRSL